jgi:hypothetical protein
MRKKRFVIGVVLGVGLVVAAGSVEARERSLHARFAGTATNKDDFSFAGTPAFYNTFAGKSTLGQYTGQLVVELQPDGNSCTAAGGGSGVEYVFVGEEVVLSFAAKGEQLFLHLSPGVTSYGCLDPATGVFTGRTTFDVNGGIGRFDGASGTVIKTWQAIFLALPASPGKGAFGSFTGTFDGTIKFVK